jgi:hypothetical protein
MSTVTDVIGDVKSERGVAPNTGMLAVPTNDSAAACANPALNGLRRRSAYLDEELVNLLGIIKLNVSILSS